MANTEITVTVEPKPIFIVGAVEQGFTGPMGPSGDAYLDGGVADSIYGAIEPIDGGNATSF